MRTLSTEPYRSSCLNGTFHTFVRTVFSTNYLFSEPGCHCPNFSAGTFPSGVHRKSWLSLSRMPIPEKTQVCHVRARSTHTERMVSFFLFWRLLSDAKKSAVLLTMLMCIRSLSCIKIQTVPTMILLKVSISFLHLAFSW